MILNITSLLFRAKNSGRFNLTDNFQLRIQKLDVIFLILISLFFQTFESCLNFFGGHEGWRQCLLELLNKLSISFLNDVMKNFEVLSEVRLNEFKLCLSLLKCLHLDHKFLKSFLTFSICDFVPKFLLELCIWKTVFTNFFDTDSFICFVFFEYFF